MIACLSVHNRLSVTYPVEERSWSGRRTFCPFLMRCTFVLSGTCPLLVRWSPLLVRWSPLRVRYLSGTRTVFIRFKPIAGASSSAGVDFYERTTNGLRFLAVLLSVGRPFALSGKVWQGHNSVDWYKDWEPGGNNVLNSFPFSVGCNVK